MQLEFEVQRSTRRCAATERPLEPGEVCYSVLKADGHQVVRQDFSASAWTGAPQEVIGWWKSRIPEAAAKKVKLAPNEILLQLFDQLADQPQYAEIRYVLALLLVRRRVMRIEAPVDFRRENSASTSHNEALEFMHVYCPKRDAGYQVLVALPTSDRIDDIQQQLSAWLVADAE